MDNNELKAGLPANVHGLPSINLDEMGGTVIPSEYEVVSVLGDILMCEIVDESDSGEICRNGIWVKQEITQKLWRVAKVVKKGPNCSVNINVDDLIMYPGDKGLRMVSFEGKKYIYLNEERIFAVVKKRV